MIGAIARVLFWRYQRGSWQYDILCIVILLFIFLTPRSLFDSRLGHAEVDPAESGTVGEDAPEESRAHPAGPEEAPHQSGEHRDAG